jgi:hypothetical protein
MKLPTNRLSQSLALAVPDRGASAALRQGWIAWRESQGQAHSTRLGETAMPPDEVPMTLAKSARGWHSQRG